MILTVGQTLAQIDAADAGKRRKRVTIIGGGMAGLVAAYELVERGHYVEVIEASKRVGGRVQTHRFSDDAYHEFGAMRIPQKHEFTLHYATDVCGLTLRPFINHHDRAERFYDIRGIVTPHSEAFHRLLPSFRLSPRETEWVTKAGTLLALFTPLDEAKHEIQGSPADLAALFGEGPQTPRIAGLERLSLGEFLRQQLDTEDAVDLLGSITGLESWWDKAFTMLLREEIALDGGGGVLHEIVGGMDSLPNELRRLIGTRAEFHFETYIREIHARGDHVQLVLSDKDGDSRRRKDSDYVICTLPFAVLRHLVTSGFSEGKRQAIRNMTYASSTKVLLHCKTRFWEADGVVGGGSQLDSIVRQVYYPSQDAPKDNACQKVGLEGVSLSSLVQTQKLQGMDNRNQLKDGALVGSYCWGADARRLGKLDKEARAETVKKFVSTIHPELLDPGMVLGHESMFWDENELAGGAFCFLRPRDFEFHYHDSRRREGCLYFAGEHCSTDYAFIQGAIRSGLDAVRDIVSD